MFFVHFSSMLIHFEHHPICFPSLSVNFHSFFNEFSSLSNPFPFPKIIHQRFFLQFSSILPDLSPLFAPSKSSGSGGAGGGSAGPPGRGHSKRRLRRRCFRFRPLELGADQRGNDHGGRAGGVGAADSPGWVRCWCCRWWGMWGKLLAG